MGLIRQFASGFGEGFRRVSNSSVTYTRIDSVEDLQDHLYGQYGTDSGQIVNPNTAMQANAVAASMRVLTSIYGATPCVLMRDLGDKGREPAKDHNLYDVILHKPNSWQSPMSFQETGKFYDLMRGGTYAWKNVVGNGRIAELILLYPEYLTIEQLPSFRLRFTYRYPGREVQVWDQDEVLRIPGLSYDGFTGLSSIGYARQTIGGALGAQKFGNNLWKNGVQPGLVVRYPLVGEKDRKALKEELYEDYGDGNWHKPMVGWGSDFEVKSLSLTSEDVQYLETKKFQRSEIATGIYGVPGNFIGDMDAASYNSIEQTNLAFLTATMGTHFKRTEQAYNIQLLTRQERTTGGLFFEFQDDWLLRGDFKSRMDALRAGILTGQFSPNEARRVTKQNPYPGGDEHYMAVNMATVQQINEGADLSGRVAPVVEIEELQ